MKDLSTVILAAGKSTRMKSKTNKVLHKLAGLPLVSYPVGESVKLGLKKLVLVIGKGQEQVFEDALAKRNDIEYCIQEDALGTGDAVLRTEKNLKDFSGYVLIIPGDVPLIQSETLIQFIKKMEDEDADCGVISTMHPEPGSYGRILRDVEGKFAAIREEKDATDLEKCVNEINTGIYVVESKFLFNYLKKVRPNNAQKEYYLTDIIELAVSEGKKVIAHVAEPHEQFLGVNDRFDLAYANKIMNLYIAESWMSKGVSIQDPDQTYIDYDVKIGQDSYIAPFTFLKGKTRIGRGCTIDAGAVLEDAVIGDNVHIRPYTVIEKSLIKEGAVVGPFSRVRPDSVLEKEVKVGNFVEVKKSVLKLGVKANHLSYIGDATIGERTNIGCGTITCNYDGEKKHRTIIGKEVFVGSDTQFIAPVKIGRGAVIGAGSTITKDVPADALALSRTEQVNVRSWVSKKRKKKK